MYHRLKIVIYKEYKRGECSDRILLIAADVPTLKKFAAFGHAACHALAPEPKAGRLKSAAHLADYFALTQPCAFTDLVEARAIVPSQSNESVAFSGI